MRLTEFFGFRMPERIRNVRDDRADIEDINYNSASIDSILNTQANNLSSETQNRIAADSALSQRIDAEAQQRESSDYNLNQTIQAETQARIAEDKKLQGQINDEVQTRVELGVKVENHFEDTSNPHNVTQTQVGLSDVPNEDWKAAVLTVAADGETSGTADTEERTSTLSAHFNWLRQKINWIFSNKANINGPDFMGTPTADTADTGTSTRQLATTEFVLNSVAESTTGVSGVKGDAEPTYRTGNVNLTYANLGTAPVANGGTNMTNIITNGLFYALNETEFAQIEQSPIDGGMLRQDTSGPPFWGAMQTVTW